MKKTFSWFRKIAFAEGVSSCFTLIAMPLKYLASLSAVTIVMITPFICRFYCNGMGGKKTNMLVANLSLL
jgi:hypothetical protein